MKGVEGKWGYRKEREKERESGIGDTSLCLLWNKHNQGDSTMTQWCHVAEQVVPCCLCCQRRRHFGPIQPCPHPAVKRSGAKEITSLWVCSEPELWLLAKQTTFPGEVRGGREQECLQLHEPSEVFKKAPHSLYPQERPSDRRTYGKPDFSSAGVSMEGVGRAIQELACDMMESENFLAPGPAQMPC